MKQKNATMPYPTFSVITVAYNAVKTINRTILSVLEQDQHLFEYIIIDGGSTDGTVDCIKKHHRNITFWVSEPDEGIYDAMNKAIEKAKGSWIFFLGADDRLKHDILKYVSRNLENSLDLVFGNIVFNNGQKYISSLNTKILLNNTVHHQGAFYNRSLFNNFRYDTSIKVMADYELNLLIFLRKKKRKKINAYIAECDAQGVSFDTKRSLNELHIIHSKYYSPFFRFFLSIAVELKYFIHYRIL